MGKGRLEAFSDGVFAIIITIMVLELKIPHGATLDALADTTPVFVSYLISFVFVGIYWNNHHHMLQLTPKINGPIMWANLHLLFWLSLVPFVTGWVGENWAAPMPTAVYGVVLLASAVAFQGLVTLLIKLNGRDSAFARAIGKDYKGKLSMAVYAVGIALSFVQHWLAVICYVAVSCIWFIPDRRIEDQIAREGTPAEE